MRAAAQGTPVPDFYRNATDADLDYWATRSREMLRHLGALPPGEERDVLVSEVEQFLAFTTEEQMGRRGRTE